MTEKLRNLVRSVKEARTRKRFFRDYDPESVLQFLGPDALVTEEVLSPGFRRDMRKAARFRRQALRRARRDENGVRLAADLRAYNAFVDGALRREYGHLRDLVNRMRQKQGESIAFAREHAAVLNVQAQQAESNLNAAYENYGRYLRGENPQDPREGGEGS